MKKSPLSKKYINVCENLFKDSLVNPIESGLPGIKVQEEYIPEPYLPFTYSRKAIMFLTASPSGVLPAQKRVKIQNGKSFIDPADSYMLSSRKLAEAKFPLLGRNTAPNVDAPRRLKLNLLSVMLDFEGFYQLASFPFFSSTVFNKPAFLKAYKKNERLNEYVNALSGTLKKSHVIALSTVGSQKSITPDIIQENDWLRWQARLMNFDDNIDMLPLGIKGKKVTSAFIYSINHNSLKGFLLTMGSKDLPAEKSLMGSGLSRIRSKTRNYSRI